MINRCPISTLSWLRLALVAVAGLLAFGPTGCTPRMGNAAAVAKAIERACDYRSKGQHEKAEQTFLLVLQHQPDSADAHLELGWLYFENTKKYVYALYHFERYTQLQPTPRPGDPRPDILQQVMNTCKQEIAQQVPLGDITLDLQRKQAVLVSSNVSLLSSNQLLLQEVAHLRGELARYRSFPGPQRPAEPESQPGRAEAASPVPQETAAQPASSSPVVRPPVSPSTTPPVTARPRTHTVRAGDTLFSLARRFNVRPQDMVRANPGVNPNNMQIGDVLTIPSP